MNGKFFLDTNIFVYEFDLREPVKTERASNLVRNAIASRRGVVSYQVVQEFFNLAFRRFAKPLPAAEAEQYLLSVFRPLLAVHSSPRLFLGALRIKETHRLSWYDSLIAAAALQADCTRLYTEDMPHGLRIEGLQIENPFRN
ncbi:MAG TPA: PIN domain-containing protein [Terriglobales bacterium]|nr:PIN domain-containing protein [Terriglobales bacterium]